MASCAMPAAPGMNIRTDTPLVKKAREGVMEFLLVSGIYTIQNAGRLQQYLMSCLDMAQDRIACPQGMSCMVLNNPILLCRSITLLIALSATREANVTSKIRSGPFLQAEPALPADRQSRPVFCTVDNAASGIIIVRSTFC